MSGLQEIFEKSVNNPHDAAFKSAFKKMTVARGFFQTYFRQFCITGKLNGMHPGRWEE